ncbi:hypothetical protein AKJ16_DCAP08927 [Drosera capensis]
MLVFPAPGYSFLVSDLDVCCEKEVDLTVVVSGLCGSGRKYGCRPHDGYDCGWVVCGHLCLTSSAASSADMSSVGAPRHCLSPSSPTPQDPPRLQ